MKNYNVLLQNRVDKKFNAIMQVTSVAALVASVILVLADIPNIYAVLNFSVAVFMLVLSLRTDRIKTSFKIIAIVGVTGIVGVASFIGGAFESTFSILLMLSNIIAVLFLDRKQSILISIWSIGLMLFLCFYSIVIDDTNLIDDPLLTWGLMILGYILFIVVLQISVYSVKDYLIENIKGLEKAVKESNQLAYYDQLTGLPNFHKFKLKVNEAIASHQKNGYIGFITLNSLGVINSTLGQDFGDQALIEIAYNLNELVGSDGIIARTGGNEFALWIEEVSDGDLQFKFDQFKAQLKSKNDLLTKKMAFYGSCAFYEVGVDTMEVTYQKAVTALMYAKANNIQSLLPYNSQLDHEIQRKEMLKDSIEQALENNEFTLYYQAQFDSRTKEVVGAEGLARWHNDVIGMVSPLEFIPIIESLNMSVKFGNYVIHQACADYHLLKEKYNETIDVSINISPSHLEDVAIVETLKSALNHYKVPANRITLEITEDVVIKNFEVVAPTLKELKELGLKIALDDFGTGYSSLSYLTQLRLDEIKIDKSFVDQIGENESINHILMHILHLSKQFNLQVIAEGVEREDQKKLLNDLGCFLIQGYYYARPEALQR